MLKRIIVALAIVGGILATAAPAQATCTTGRIGADVKEKKVYLEFPQCYPPPMGDY